ncbi:MAG: NADH-quinone oxidoreductase subunit NuoE [Phycisphaerales bacterium]|jgi:NADH-quinone oxidoreductase subunit E|nr:NADH-quinone oxidoreductase subunit NuoE [Phycisphaerales bacterium]
MSIDITKVESILAASGRGKGVLIPILQAVQNEFGYVPREAVDCVAETLDVFPVDIYGILTFYSQFYLEPRGRYTIRVCQGTACHVMGSKEVLDHFSRQLGIEDGGTTEDGVFSLERVACLGCCGMAPVVAVGEEFYGAVDMTKADELIATWRAKAEESE